MVWPSDRETIINTQCSIFERHQPAYIWDRAHFPNMTTLEFGNLSQV